MLWQGLNSLAVQLKAAVGLVCLSFSTTLALDATREPVHISQLTVNVAELFIALSTVAGTAWFLRGVYDKVVNGSKPLKKNEKG